MIACKFIAARHDRGNLLHCTSSVSMTASFITSRRESFSWFRLLDLAAQQSRLELMNHGLLRDWRCQPIPVGHSSGYLATKKPGWWSRFVRI
jgi:hypothetical protein